MNDQSKTLQIAEELESLEATPSTCGAIHQAAFELRRLHAENERLREALKVEREACAKTAEVYGLPGVGAVVAAEIRAKGE